MPLTTFIAKNGGLELDSDTRAADFHKLYVPGAGMLARKSGKSIDGFWRDFLISNGWLEPDLDGYSSRDIRNELFDKIHDEQRARYFGSFTKSHDDEESGHDEFDVLKQQVFQAVKEAGIKPDEALVMQAAYAMRHGDHEDPLEAYEHAAMADAYHGHMGEPKPSAQPRKPVVNLPPPDDVPF